MHLLDIHDLWLQYGHHQALAGLNLTLSPGSIGLVGNNGAGKSSLLKVLLGLVRPQRGTGTVLGCDIRYGGRALRGQVGYMPETAGIVPVLKGVEFVSLAGDLYGMPHRDAQRRAHEVLSYVGLGEMRYRRLEEYSTGNLQRLKLAAALVHDPRLLLLDEPTGGLDPQGRLAMLRTLEDLIRDTGKSVIICTHLLADVERLCGQVVLMHRGQILGSGTVADLRSSIADQYIVAWNGESSVWLRQLQRAGATILDDTHHVLPHPSLRSAAKGTNGSAWNESRDSSLGGVPAKDSSAAAKAAATNGTGSGELEAHGVSANGTSLNGVPHRAVVSVPRDFASLRFFEIAHEAGVTITELRPDIEDLDRIFLRLTRSQDTPQEKKG